MSPVLPPPPPTHDNDSRGGVPTFETVRVADAVRVADPLEPIAGLLQPPPATGRSTVTATLADSAAVPRYAIAIIVPVCATPVLSAGLVFWRTVTQRLSPPAQSTASGPTGEVLPGVHTHDWTCTVCWPSPRRAVNLTWDPEATCDESTTSTRRAGAT